MSINYYDNNAEQFAKDTLSVDMRALYDSFLPLLPKNALILDAGCGAGRDAANFLQFGYRVCAFDASEQLTKIASQHSGLCVKQCTFLEYKSTEPLDAIWACASLLHVPDHDLNVTMKHLAKQLKTGGIFYLSFKYGEEDSERGGRYFTNSTEKRLSKHLQDSNLNFLKCWITGDQRVGREKEQWLNALLVKEYL